MPGQLLSRLCPIPPFLFPITDSFKRFSPAVTTSWAPWGRGDTEICPCPGCPGALRPCSQPCLCRAEGFGMQSQPRAQSCSCTGCNCGVQVVIGASCWACCEVFCSQHRHTKRCLPLLPPTALRDKLLPPEPGLGTAPAGLASWGSQGKPALRAGNHPSSLEVRINQPECHGL